MEVLPATTLDEAVEPNASSEDATDDEEEEDEEDEEEEEEDVLCLAAADTPLTTPVLRGQSACLFHSQSFRIHV